MALQVEKRSYEWFEGSISPWEPAGRPLVHWNDVAKAVRDLGFEPPGPSIAPYADARTQALAMLPHLYALGVNRASMELVSGPAYEGRIRLFPLIGFAPSGDDPSAPPYYKTLRMNVAVIDRAIFTIRLPDLKCPDDLERDADGMLMSDLPESARVATDRLEIPDRFFPRWEADAMEVAEEIGRHQAATARALADRIRGAMPKERSEQDGWDVDSAGGAPQSRPAAAGRSSLASWLRGETGAGLPVDALDGWPRLMGRLIARSVAWAARRLWRLLAGLVRWTARFVTGIFRRPPQRGAGDGESASKSVPTPSPHEESSALARVAELTQIVQVADRQLSRLLRRLGSYGEETPAERAAAAGDEETPSQRAAPADGEETPAQRAAAADARRHAKRRRDMVAQAAHDLRQRYRYAVDEMRSLNIELAALRDRETARLAAKQKEDRERFQFIAALVGSAILIPTLVAGIFGANVEVPGKGKWTGFAALLLFIVAFAAGGAWMIDAAWRRRWRAPAMWRVGVAALALVCVAAGLVIVIA
jgi:hypothetical protein